MPETSTFIPIDINGIQVRLLIWGEQDGEGLMDVADAEEHGEARFQIKEGCSYGYEIEVGFLLQKDEIVIPLKKGAHYGRICPNIYVGRLSIKIVNDAGEVCGSVELEVQSKKAEYRTEYRFMLEQITNKCTDLLLYHSALVTQYFEVDFNADANTLYQRFAFIKSVLDSPEFNDSVHRIVSAPVTKWKEGEVVKDIRSVRRFNSSAIRQLVSTANRIDLPETHPLYPVLPTMPTRLRVSNNTETVDTPENRFIKHALTSFQTLSSDFKYKAVSSPRIVAEAGRLVDQIEQFLSHSVFKEISAPTTLPLNSPVLQRKEGYREVLRVWLMFDLAAKLVWKGGDDVYSAGKRDVATLYEYWLFFKLLDIVKEVFRIEPKSVGELISPSGDGLGLQLKQGEHLAVSGTYDGGTRKLNVEFSYNRTFPGNKSYPDGGSWTRSMRPDYTLSIWNEGISQKNAERDELIVHVHFDAKYKVEKLNEILGDANESDENTALDKDKDAQKRGTYKRADLLKMHSYKDAIRRTAGAYVLYPGTGEEYTKSGFHELIPGLGAFSIRPSETNDGSENLQKFLVEIVDHFMNRASQRERISLKAYETYKIPPPAGLYASLPNALGNDRALIPDETYVLVAFYKDAAHLNWIENGLYNARTETRRGSLRLGPGESGAKFLLLHGPGETTTNRIFQVTGAGPRVFSKKTLIDKGYPSVPSQEYYIVYEISKVVHEEFAMHRWDITKLADYKGGRGSGLPFAVTLTELMQSVVR